MPAPAAAAAYPAPPKSGIILVLPVLVGNIGVYYIVRDYVSIIFLRSLLRISKILLSFLVLFGAQMVNLNVALNSPHGSFPKQGYPITDPNIL